MNIHDIKAALEYNSGTFPSEAMQAAVARREEITPILLAELERAADNPQALLDEPDTYMLHFYAMYLLAQFRESRALAPLIRLCHLPEETLDTLLGDVITEDLGAILASLCGGDTAPIMALIGNGEVGNYVRDAGIGALLTLVAEGALERGELIEYLRTLSHTLQPDDWTLWGFWVAAADEIYPEELMPEIRAAYTADAVDESFIKLRNVERTLQEGRDETLARLRESRRYLTDAIGAMSDWSCFHEVVYLPGVENEEDDEDNDDGDGGEWYPPQDPYVRETPKIGRNDPCPCGSGKKYKKCCGLGQ